MADTSATSVADAIKAERGIGADAASVPPKRGRGRPKGSKTGAGKTAAPNPQEAEPYIPTEANIAAAALLAATLWKIAGPMLKLDSLEKDEAREIGMALDPILHKYVPMLDDWREEVTLVMALVGAYEVTRKRYREEHPEDFKPKPRYPHEGPDTREPNFRVLSDEELERE